jgi:uncharacterized protein (TIGR02466 family)
MPFEFFFPKTFYYRDNLIEEEANLAIADAAFALRKEFPRSTRQNLYTTYGSLPNVLLRPALTPLREALQDEIAIYLNQIETRSDKRWMIPDSWISISSPGDYERMHTHPGSYVSGVFYIRAPIGCGNLCFENLEDNLWSSLRTRKENLSAISYEARERRLILFNSQMPHHVERNLSTSERIALSFNVAL